MNIHRCKYKMFYNYSNFKFKNITFTYMLFIRSILSMYAFHEMTNNVILTLIIPLVCS